jgi:hypothetical protein
MLFRTYHPGPPLGDFVEVLWLYEGFARPAHERERLLPDGSVEVVFNLAEDKIRLYDRENTDKFRTFHGSIISGPHTSEDAQRRTAQSTRRVGGDLGSTGRAGARAVA